MLSELCQELKNWFDKNQPKIYGDFEISEGKIVKDDFIDVIQNNQYFRIIGSVFNDGVYKYTNDLELIDETFNGSIWLMAIPADVIALSNEIDKWLANYSEAVNSPYSSESFGGYSYSKASGGSGNGASSVPTWQSTFASRLNLYRRINAL